jgi:hypothetical protein
LSIVNVLNKLSYFVVKVNDTKWEEQIYANALNDDSQNKLWDETTFLQI